MFFKCDVFVVGNLCEENEKCIEYSSRVYCMYVCFYLKYYFFYIVC